MGKDTLLGKTLTEIQLIVKELDMPAFSAKQIADWLYKKKITSIDEMTNLSVKHRLLLNEKYVVGAVKPSDAHFSNDGTIKYLFNVGEKGAIESVYIPDEERHTLCVSSQVGCKMGCLFCMTGKQGFRGNLSACEIINQMQSINEASLLTNVVFMGMGEPMDNIDEVLKVLEIMTAPYGYAWSPKRITVSTIGLLPGLKRLLAESDCHVAISLHNAKSAERLALMPVEKAYPLVQVLEEIRKYDFSHQRRVSFEYIMFKGVNDTPQHAKVLKLLLKGLLCRVNLIRYHAIPGVELECSDELTMINFRDALTGGGIISTIRSSRGEDIFAACGMLSTEKLNQK